MTDLHTHILPNIDDGADSLEEALKMTEAIFRQNVRSAVCTPHFNPAKTSLQDFIEKRAIAMERMKESKIILILGSETILHDTLFYYKDISELCIRNTRYLLLELPYNHKWNLKIYELLDKIITHYDVIPMIAHIERYITRQNSRKNIQKLRNIGCVIQLNTSTIIDTNLRKKALRYIKMGYIDVLGSDCHNMKKRSPMIADAFDIVMEQLGEQCCKELKRNSECIVNGIDIRKNPVYIIE